MGERRENSVLFSLSELRRIEQQRIQEEETAQRAREAAELAARQEAEKRARQEEEAKRRQVEDAAMRERVERDRVGREDQLRLQEVESRARVEAETRLREKQLHLEIQARASMKKQPPVKAIVGGVVVLFVVVCGLGYYLYQQKQQQEAERVHQAQILAQKEQEQRALEARIASERLEMGKLKQNIEALETQMRNAKTESDRVELKRRLSMAKNQLAARATTSNGDRSDSPKIRLGTTGNDPLEGLK